VIVFKFAVCLLVVGLSSQDIASYDMQWT